MGVGLTISKVTYWGDKYQYSSPELGTGLEIIEASNGSGKTTFSSLICYGMGVYVKQFDFKEKTEVHQEILSDTNNYVLLKVAVDNVEYEFTRYFHKDNRNTIYIKGSDGYTNSYPVYRNAETPEIFSDWLLSKLGIQVCEVYQGTRKFKINFSDLFRLIHYDQNTPPYKIFKEHRHDNNFLADSNLVRRVIFELLIGQHFSEYYALLGEFHRAEKEKEVKKDTLNNYIAMASNINFDLQQLNYEILGKRIEEANQQLSNLWLYREELKRIPNNASLLSSHAIQLRRDLVNFEEKFGELKARKRQLSFELQNLAVLKEEIILEVTQIKKIIVAHQELNLFSPNTCPYCLREVDREENHCICGSPIDESRYERFFYNADEYLDILKSKQKSVETVDVAISSCRGDLSAVERRLAEVEIKRSQVRSQLREVEQTAHMASNDAKLLEVNDRILEVKEQIQHLDQQQQLFQKYAELRREFLESENEFSALSHRVHQLEGELARQTDRQISQFEMIYTDYMKKVEHGISHTELDENYMPVINHGEYRQASSNVAKRLMYYLTLLKMSLDNKQMPYPRFLLIDTPENLGIDKDNLDECLVQIEELVRDRGMFQVILTTGIGKYPSELKPYVIETLTEDSKLLKHRE